MENIMTNSSSNNDIHNKNTVENSDSNKASANNAPLADAEIETHPFTPVLPPDATVMMMGTFPPTSDKWAMRFHYPNFYNDMWRIYGGVFFDDVNHFRIGNEKHFNPEHIRDFLFERGIALCPTVRQAIRETGNASDKNLTVVTPVNLDDILPQVPKLTALFTTGGKATEVLLNLLETPPAKSKYPKTNQDIDYPYQWHDGEKLENIKVNDLTLYRLPSTSRAYPLALDKKIAAYKAFFEKMGKL